tara:strand:- start:12360 stop:13037 length:678 start_codon:yes stop_codon:yes gene_type:complete
MAVLSIENLEKQYFIPGEGMQVVLSVDNFQLSTSEQVALKGSSGCGKSTFLNTIAGITSFERGSIIVDGIDIQKLNEAQRDKLRGQKIGYIFQSFHLLPGYTAYENVILGMSFNGNMNHDLAKDLLVRVGLEDRMLHTPGQLSVGQRQRVAVARALANNPCLVLADEPTANLDIELSLSVIQLIKDLCTEYNAAMLLVTHDDEILSQFGSIKNLEIINKAYGATS